jgi:hypothetical protein
MKHKIHRILPVKRTVPVAGPDVCVDTDGGPRQENGLVLSGQDASAPDRGLTPFVILLWSSAHAKKDVIM